MTNPASELFSPFGLGGSPLPWVKICGVTRVDDAGLALELGADLLGINLWPRSSRYLPPARAAELLAALPHARFLAVVVLDATFNPREVAGLPVAGFQVHGARSEEDLPDLGRPLLVAVTPEELGLFPGHPVIVDSSWGAGRRADWRRLSGTARPYFLSGGLDPDNVAEAVRLLKPAGLDVCSGVEAAPGLKSAARLRAFMQAVERERALPVVCRHGRSASDQQPAGHCEEEAR